MSLRDARPEDAAAIREIFNAAQPLPAAVWRDAPARVEEIAGWLSGPDAKSVVLVAERAGVVLGFAALGAFKTGPGWHVSAEISLYVRADARGGGIGAALCRAVCARGREIGLATILTAIDNANAGSIKLHARCGFERIGEIKRAGMKSGALRDLTLMQILL